MGLDAETGIYTFDDGPEFRELEGMYDRLRQELGGKTPERVREDEPEKAIRIASPRPGAGSPPRKAS